jgi:hypothetical protein
MGVTPVELYRAGNSTGPRMDHVRRNRDIVVIQQNGVDWVDPQQAEFRHGKECTGPLLIGGEFLKVLRLRICWSSERTIAAIGYGSPHKEWNLLNTCGCLRASIGNLFMCRALQPLEIQI